ncbi:MAG TPA: hypothetical protein VFI25_11115 [Planctomycetota bacterium]|jgi:hypothetical protein|nr:hypothetical protein [Planctomycetota bacterium]
MTASDDWFGDFIRPRRLFILGAGFSAGAGIPMTGEILAGAMKRFREEEPGPFERVDGQVRARYRLDKSDPDYANLPLAEICTFLHYRELREHGGGERFADAGSGENLSLRYFLAKEVASRTPLRGAIPPIYRRFAEQLHPGDIIISFNWDTLLELALEAVGKPYSYQVTNDRIPVLKFHGSINWRVGLPKRPASRWRPLGFATGAVQEEIYCREALVDPRSWRRAQRVFGEVEPFIVLPGLGKAFDVRRLAHLWYKPEYAFAFSHDIFMIGLGLARDDFIVDCFLRDNLPYLEGCSSVPGRRIVVINPDLKVAEQYDFLAGVPNVEFRCECFSDHHIDLMAPTDAPPDPCAGAGDRSSLPAGPSPSATGEVAR